MTSLISLVEKEEEQGTSSTSYVALLKCLLQHFPGIFHSVLSFFSRLVLHDDLSACGFGKSS